MGDPFLDAHRVARLSYIISGPAPISIRDQMLRGVLAARRLYEQGEISASRPLVVIGAGAGGATAAIEAARIGVTVDLVESAARGFLAQRLARSRVIDPTQYDWPVDHYHYARLPWGGHTALPLPFRANRADWLSISWGWQLAAWQRVLAPRLRVHFGTRLTTRPRYNRHAKLLEVDFGRGAVNAGALIDAKGFGNEQCAVFGPGGATAGAIYEGQAFWGPDSFAMLNPARHTVLISGSGDGALQDYIRVLTHLDRAIDVEQRLSLPIAIKQAIQSAEDRSHRGRSWVRDDNRFLRNHQEGPFFRELELEHRRQVHHALTLLPIRAVLAAIVPRPAVPVSLIYRDQYLGCYYGLNRFIALLLAEYLFTEHKVQTLFPGCEIVDILPAGHTCINPPHIAPAGRASGSYAAGTGMLIRHDCFEKSHQVTFTTMAPQTFNVIIIRHGLTQTMETLQRRRHLLPYHQP